MLTSFKGINGDIGCGCVGFMSRNFLHVCFTVTYFWDVTRHDIYDKESWCCLKIDFATVEFGQVDPNYLHTSPVNDETAISKSKVVFITKDTNVIIWCINVVLFREWIKKWQFSCLRVNYFVSLPPSLSKSNLPFFNNECSIRWCFFLIWHLF